MSAQRFNFKLLVQSLLPLVAILPFQNCSYPMGEVQSTSLSSVADVSPEPEPDPEIQDVIDVEEPAPEPVTTLPKLYLIDVGSVVDTVDAEGRTWLADFGAHGGTAYDRGELAIENTLHDKIYSTERYCADRYSFAAANGNYSVVLHFAENYDGVTASGQRVFDIAVENMQLTDLDIFAEAGERNKALMKSLNVTVQDGSLDIVFSKKIQCPILQGIEILGAEGSIRLDSGNTPAPEPEPAPVPAPEPIPEPNGPVTYYPDKGALVALGSEVNAVSTYHNIGLYWTAPKPNETGYVSAFLGETKRFGDAKVEFCQVNSVAEKKCISPWQTATPLWYDARDGEYRGSILNLKSGSHFKIRVIHDSAKGKEIVASTWSEVHPVAKTIYVDQDPVKFPAGKTIYIDSSMNGTAGGYTLITSKDPNKVFDVRNSASPNNISDKNHIANVVVKAGVRFVIIRGLKLKGGHLTGINLGENITSKVHADISDVVIENNHITDWGSKIQATPGSCPSGLTKGTTLGYSINHEYPAVKSDMGGIASTGTGRTRITIQRNTIYKPRYGSNSWQEAYNNGTGCTAHPFGPIGIILENAGGNNVIRYNEISGEKGVYGGSNFNNYGHYYNDGILLGDKSNAQYMVKVHTRDTDVYGNVISNVWDDGIETDSANMNLRIYGNYFDKVFVSISFAPSTVGPTYLFKNVSHQSQKSHYQYPSYNNGSIFLKVQSSSVVKDSSGNLASVGKIFVVNNTVLAPKPAAAGTERFYDNPKGHGGLLSNGGGPNWMTNYVILNNIASTMGIGANPNGGQNVHTGCNLLSGKLNRAAGVTGTSFDNITDTPYNLVADWATTSTYSGKYYVKPATAGSAKTIERCRIQGVNPLSGPFDLGAHDQTENLKQYGPLAK